MKRKASAVWNGDLKTGKGSITTESGALSNAQYSFLTRFESGVGTNPEELIAAAHAGCFSMALSAQLSGAGLKPEKIETSAAVTLEMQEKVPGIDAATFEKVASDAKAGCPISRLLNAKISMNAVLEK